MIQDKIVFITGASSGIGAACAEAFAEEGAKLVLCARRLERLESLASSLRERFGTETRLLELDVRDREEVVSCCASLEPDWRSVDVLINNAGLAAGKDKLFEADIDDWERMIDTNLKGLLYVSRALVPGMVERGSGHVINIGSIAGYDAYSGGAVYCGTKFFVRGLSRALKMDLLGTGVRVSSVDPGAVDTEFSDVRFSGDADAARAVYRGMTPLHAEDVAQAVLFCATRPAHVNVSQLLVLPTDQGGAHSVYRREPQ